LEERRLFIKIAINAKEKEKEWKKEKNRKK